MADMNPAQLRDYRDSRIYSAAAFDAEGADRALSSPQIKRDR